MILFLSVEFQYNELEGMQDFNMKYYIENGNGLFLTFIKEKQEFLDGEIVRVYDISDRFFGLYRFDEEKQMLKTWKMFL